VDEEKNKTEPTAIHKHAMLQGQAKVVVKIPEFPVTYVLE